MNYFTYEELEKFVIKQLEKESPQVKSNIKNVGLWLKKNGFKRIRKQTDNERRLYYYLPDTDILNDISQYKATK